jgi:hypothetical protein
VSLKSRLRRLDSGVRWLETKGAARRKYKMRLARIRRAFAGHRIGDRGMVAGRKNKSVPSLPLPPPRVKPPPAAPRVVPILRDAAVPAAPQDEVVHVAPPSQPPPRPPEPRWTKDNRPGPHDVLSWEEAMQVPWVDSSAEDEES